MPIVVSNPRVKSNTAADFLQWVEYLVDNHHLVHGDIFIVDNASVHKAAEIVDRLTEVLDTTGVRMVFLPTYSPELNPCELVFGAVKRHIRANRHGLLWPAIVSAFAHAVNYTAMVKSYIHCLQIGLR
jgi:transposase